eukprot:CAMPEP_0167747154 /NCGR_PEP_ID=MMETSP0110_2-20121227/4123_1 /TAXON_ID=629695 /ORGANISM="Gymnochlora sp., Strain CCMP2014" /LENGTH=398 /DNA_ID=CAMNT_0007632023 /DNA_START=461 /DNA_END=1657 /DNA_ORIENTATION=+
MILNALQVDPGRLWKGPWRWYSEDMLDCCKPLEEVKLKGLTYDEWACLALCNGLQVSATRAADTTEEKFRETVKSVSRCCGSEEKAQATQFLVVTYTRKGLGQTGSGHFTPIGGYDPVSDSVLLLDVARFKYPPHWVTIPVLFKAMQPLDPDTKKSRGFFVISKSKHQSKILFRLKGLQHPVSQLKIKFTRLLETLRSKAKGSRNKEEILEDIVSGCLDVLDSDEGQHGPLLTTVIGEFSRSVEQKTRKFQKWHIEMVPRKHMEAIRELVHEIEHTSLYAEVQKIMKTKLWCDEHPSTSAHSKHVHRETFSISKPHLLTVLILAVVPRVTPKIKEILGSCMDTENLKDPLKSELISLADSWDGLCVYTGSVDDCSAITSGLKKNETKSKGKKSGCGCR